MAALELTPEQRAVVVAPEEPLLVLAAPGTGKTAVVAARIANLIAERGIGPASVLALTFSNRAAGELRTRLVARLGDDGRAVDVATFHGFGLRVLRQWQTRLGYPPAPLRVCDEREAEALLAEALADFGAAAGRVPLRALSRAVERYRLDGGGGAHAATLQAIAEAFEARLRARSAIDYPGMLILALRLLRERPEVVRLYRLAYRAILLDEAQDTCAVQYALVRQLAARHRHLVLVGDPAQSLFAWRGADGSVLRAFLRDFPEAAVRTLSRNFRSTPQIVAVANAIGAGLPLCLALQAAAASGPPPILHRAADEGAEADYIAEELVRLLRIGAIRNPSEAAVLIRASAQALPIAAALRSRGLFSVPPGQTVSERPGAASGPIVVPGRPPLASGAAPARSVRLLTIHAAKGLEWPAVFLAGLEEGLLPHRRALEGGETVEAVAGERRAAYVAVTRPRLRLYLTCCRSRTRAGLSTPCRPSRFLEDLAGLPLSRAS